MDTWVTVRQPKCHDFMDIPKLIWKPFEAGGTWLMDFPVQFEETIVQAIFNLKLEHLVLCNLPCIIPDCSSIHTINDEFDLQSLWEECDKIEKDKN